MQIHEDISFCVMHLLRACCDYECWNYGIVANFFYVIWEFIISKFIIYF